MQTHTILAPFHAQHPDVAPILILAPTPRCGSTLLQRAINEGGDAIIYGENFLWAEWMPKLVAADLDKATRKIQITLATFEEFMRGNKGMDASALYPDYEAYYTMLLGFFYQIGEFYREQSSRHGYSRWGMKHQMHDWVSFSHFMRLLPTYRGIILYRDVVAVAKSKYARWPESLTTPAQFHQLGRRWRDNLRYLLKQNNPQTMIVKYEDLTAGKQEYIPRIEEHLGLRLSREAFERKVNVHTFDDSKGEVGETYKAPAELAEPMVSALLKGAAPLYNHLGYQYDLSSMAHENN